LWKQQEELNSEGWVDYQAHGVAHTPPIDADSTEAYILGELQGPIPVFLEHFKKTPIAVIWPGGGFTKQSVRLARQVGYRLGFTINPRGPLMFDWIPLADANDPARDTWTAEGPAGDPLMTLPRYWDTDAIGHLEEVIQIGQAAAAYAQANRPAEMDFYDTICMPDYGAIP
jgi:peptidoglycan/xylan/chitin deacetylase (PgdA/CDA1 family)